MSEGSDGYSELVRALHAPGVIDAIVDSAKSLPETKPRTSVDLLSLAAETSGVGIGKRALIEELNAAVAESPE